MQWDRKFTGIELKAEYIKLARKNIIEELSKRWDYEGETDNQDRPPCGSPDSPTGEDQNGEFTA